MNNEAPTADAAFKEKLGSRYIESLLEDVMPFWERHALDQKCGGYLSSLDRDGTVVDTDKAVWVQGRMAWMFSSLYLAIEPRQSWLSHAKLGIDFLEEHCFAPSGKMYFLVTRNGQPLRMRRHFFSEAFAAAGFAAYAKAAGSLRHCKLAIDVFERFMAVATGKISTEPKWDATTRPQIGLGVPMITLWLGQQLREHIPEHSEQATLAIDWAAKQIRELFYKPSHGVLMETVSPSGEIYDRFEGRQLNPGHALEAAWFLLIEAKRDPSLREMAINIADWMWDRGWDKEYGGLLYFVDIDGRPVQEYWHDMKFWWPQNEAEVAMLMAWEATGEPRFRKRLGQVHEYQFQLFPDPEYGEWFGYFHRDGRRSSTLKGNQWKSAFHIPRMLLQGYVTLAASKHAMP